MKKILIIEDDETLVKMYQKLLSSHGYQVAVANEAKSGLDIIKNQSFDLILLDLMLPGGMNGFDVLEEIKRNSNFKNIPVLIMTNIESEEKTAHEIGANEYLIKINNPPEKILAKINRILNNVK